MKSITNNSGTKAVNFRVRDGYITCMYVEIYKGEEQVLDDKEYKSEKMALKWAAKKLA